MGNDFNAYFRTVTAKKITASQGLFIGNQSVYANKGNSYFVDSGATGAADTRAGTSWATCLATIDGAINKCTANQGDVIYVAEGHAESYTTTGAKATFDIAGITLVCLGQGADRPTFTFGHADATWTISAASVTIINALFVTAIDSVVTYGTISGADCKLINCESRDATDKEVLDAWTVSTLANRLKVTGYKHVGYIGGDANDSIFQLTGVDDFEFKDCIFLTQSGTTAGSAVIEMATACLRGVIDSCLFYVDGKSDYSDDIADTAGTSTVIVRNCFDLEAGSKFSGGGNGSSFSVAGDDVGAVSTALATVDTVVDAIKAVTDVIPNSGALTYLNSNVVTKSITTIANGDTNLFDLTGEVEIEALYGIVTGATQDSACTYKFDFYDATTETDLCTATSIQNKGVGTNLAITGTFGDALVVTAGNASQGQKYKFDLSDGGDTGSGVIRGVSDAAITGTATFFCKYRALSSDGAIAAAT